jgi:hypothetical protein
LCRPDPIKAKDPEDDTEFWSIIKGKEANRKAIDKLAGELRSKDLAFLIGPQLEKLENHLKVAQYHAEVASIQSKVLSDRNEMPESASDQLTQIGDLEKQLYSLLKNIHSSLHHRK